MSLFGTFADVSLPDVISLIGNGSGKFIVRQQNEEQVEHYELNLESGHISRMTFNEQEIHSTEQARSFFTELIRNNKGEFEFQRGPIVKGTLWINITEALLSSVSFLDELAGLRESFPDPQTVFIENTTGYGVLTAELHQFWLSVEPHFRKGISALDLSESVGLFLDQIQLKLYKLQLAKVIVPKRAFYKTEPLPSREEISIMARNIDQELQNMISKLEPIWSQPVTTPIPQLKVKTVPLPENKEKLTLRHMPKNGTVPIPKTREHAAAQPEQETQRLDFSSVKIYRPDKVTVGHFISSLKKIMRSR